MLLHAPAFGRARSLGRRFNDLLRRRPDGDVAHAPGALRVALIGNCQAAAIASAVRVLLPGAAVTYESVYGIARRFPRMSDLVARFRDHDAVFATGFHTSFADGAPFEALRAGVRLVQIPVIVFPAFHPDLVYVGDLANPAGHIRTALGPYNSALTLFGYLADLSPEETARLFDPAVFAGLGYLDMWEEATAGLLSLGRDASYDLTEDVLRWARRGAFMHSINHPKMFVACDLARGLLAKAGMAASDLDVESYAPDELMRQGTWPIYPAVAERYGIAGGYAFVGRGQTPPVYDLLAFVRSSFAAYAKRRRAELACARVEGWLANEPVRAELVRRARG